MDNRLLFNEIQKIKIMLETIKVSGKEHFNVKEAALYLGISESTLENPTKLTTSVRYKLTTIDRLKLTTPIRIKLTTWRG